MLKSVLLKTDKFCVFLSDAEFDAMEKKRDSLSGIEKVKMNLFQLIWEDGESLLIFQASRIVFLKLEGN